MGSRRLLAVAVIGACVLVLALGGVRGPARPAAAAAPVSLTVTNAGDGATAVCPDATRCTLRRAISVANAADPAAAVTIAFAPSVFPAASPVTIAVTTSSLPVVAHANATVDASTAGVVVDGSALPDGSDGLVMSGPQASVQGLGLRHFSGSCLTMSAAGATVGGDSTAGAANEVGDCGVGILISGPDATVRGNRIGFVPGSDEAAPVDTGLLVTAATATIGGTAIGPALANRVGNAKTAVRVGDGAGPLFAGVTIGRNIVGRDGTGAPAPVDIGVQLKQPSRATRVLQNTIANATLAGVQIVPDAGSASVTGNRVQGNHFTGLGGMAIDLDADGARNPNDEGDTDAGPNGLLNYPVFTRATQARLTGSAGPSCAGCQVELYLAAHFDGAATDYGSDPVPVAFAGVDLDGSFSFEAPPVVPGQWVIATVTDALGNTSEFGPSARVGSGVVQCGNLGLQRGWNLLGFFGPSPVNLGLAFPESGPGSVQAVYHLEDGTLEYTHWFSATPVGRTLTTLSPGESYWFLVDEPFVLPAGFSLSVPLPVALTAGWNDFVYIGATASVRDALSSIEGKYSEVYQYTNDGADERWRTFGVETPAWARGFDDVQSCGAYMVNVTEDVTLVPLQP